MADAAKIEAAARLLAQGRAPGRAIGVPPAELAPSDADEAWAMHEAAVAALGPVAGWKTGAPTPTAPAGAGMITAGTLHRSPASFAAGAFRLAAVEAEVAVVVGRDFGPRAEPYGRDEVLAAVVSWHAAIEVLDTAFAAEDWAAAAPLWRLADRQSHGALVVGPAAEGAPQGALDRLRVTLEIDGAEAFSHEGGNTGGDPARLLAGLVNLRRETARPVRAGDVVTTGSATPFLRARPGQTVAARFDGLPAAELVIAAG